MARSDPTDYVVEVLEGPAAGATVVLQDRALPYRGADGGSISYGVEQRSKLTWYQGNPEASQQIFGPTYPPTTINGVWKDRYLGEDRSIDLVEMFEELCEQGVQVLVRWSTIERRGIVKSVRFIPLYGLTDLQWEITFEWSAKVRGSVQRINTGESGTRDALAGCAQVFSSLEDAVEAFATAVVAFVGLANTLFSGAGTVLKSIKLEVAPAREGLISAAAQLSLQPTLPARLGLSTVASLEACANASTAYGETVAEVFPGSVVLTDDPSAMILHMSSRAEVVDLSFTALEQIAAQAAKLRAQVQPEAAITIRTNRGIDLRDVAMQFFGTSDAWERIAAANGIATSLVPDDVQELVIPLALPDTLAPGIQGI